MILRIPNIKAVCDKDLMLVVVGWLCNKPEKKASIARTSQLLNQRDTDAKPAEVMLGHCALDVSVFWVCDGVADLVRNKTQTLWASLKSVSLSSFYSTLNPERQIRKYKNGCAVGEPFEGCAGRSLNLLRNHIPGGRKLQKGVPA